MLFRRPGTTDAVPGIGQQQNAIHGYGGGGIQRCGYPAFHIIHYRTGCVSTILTCPPFSSTITRHNENVPAVCAGDLLAATGNRTKIWVIRRFTAGIHLQLLSVDVCGVLQSLASHHGLSAFCCRATASISIPSSRVLCTVLGLVIM